MLTRRQFLHAAGALAAGACAREPGETGVVVNDVHSRLNATRVTDIARPRSLQAVRQLVLEAGDRGRALSVAGGRHAMGGQQFGTATRLIDTTQMNRVLAFDADRGTIEVEAGIQWPGLIAHYLEAQAGRPRQWGIAQKQTGADRLSVGGALAANAHGRGLTMKPFVGDVESFTLVGADGQVRVCSRAQHPELFRLAVGGYGLFGIVYAVTLRLAPRRKVQRIVEVITADELADALRQRVAAGFLYGDFQFATDEQSDAFLHQGVFSCYRPVDPATPVPEEQRQLSEEDWATLVYLAHANKTAAFERYVAYYRQTSGQIYWSDTHQLSTYLDDYHPQLDQRLSAVHPATEMISELYVPRPALAGFMADAGRHLRETGVPVIYGTVRLIQRDEETFLAWAREPYACVIFNLHTEHTPAGLARTADAFRGLIDLALQRGGSYYLTYHRYARRDQVGGCYPQLPQFLRLKRQYDPEERFQSDWYRYYRDMFADVL